MEAYSQLLYASLHTLEWLLMLGFIFAVCETIMPCNPGVAWWQDLRGTATDLIYWLIVPLFLRYIRWSMIIFGVVLVVGTHNDAALREYLTRGFGRLSQLSLLQQCILILLFQDVFMYWVHRLFHTRFAWPFHAVHHSSTSLNWLSTQRFHPVNNILEFALADVLALMLGFSPEALVVLVPFNIAFSAYVHSNLRLQFGPLKYVIVSPVFHRWHHTQVTEGGMKNFAPTFSFLDIIFGTFYMPKNKLPQTYGVDISEFPKGFWGQFFYPFQTNKDPS